MNVKAQKFRRKALLVVAALAACGSAVVSCDSPTPRNAAKEDADTMKLLATTPRKAEALSWLNINDGKDRTVGKDDPIYTHVDSVRFVQSLYSAGAVRVMAVDIGADRNLEGTRTLIVSMPRDREKRRRILDIVNKATENGGFEADPDFGQKFDLVFWG